MDPESALFRQHLIEFFQYHSFPLSRARGLAESVISKADLEEAAAVGQNKCRQGRRNNGSKKQSRHSAASSIPISTPSDALVLDASPASSVGAIDATTLREADKGRTDASAAAAEENNSDAELLSPPDDNADDDDDDSKLLVRADAAKQRQQREKRRRRERQEFNSRYDDDDTVRSHDDGSDSRSSGSVSIISSSNVDYSDDDDAYSSSSSSDQLVLLKEYYDEYASNSATTPGIRSFITDSSQRHNNKDEDGTGDDDDNDDVNAADLVLVAGRRPDNKKDQHQQDRGEIMSIIEKEEQIRERLQLCRRKIRYDTVYQKLLKAYGAGPNTQLYENIDEVLAEKTMLQNRKHQCRDERKRLMLKYNIIHQSRNNDDDDGHRRNNNADRTTTAASSLVSPSRPSSSVGSVFSATVVGSSSNATHHRNFTSEKEQSNNTVSMSINITEEDAANRLESLYATYAPHKLPSIPGTIEKLRREGAFSLLGMGENGGVNQIFRKYMSLLEAKYCTGHSHSTDDTQTYGQQQNTQRRSPSGTVTSDSNLETLHQRNEKNEKLLMLLRHQQGTKETGLTQSLSPSRRTFTEAARSSLQQRQPSSPVVVSSALKRHSSFPTGDDYYDYSSHDDALQLHHQTPPTPRLTEVETRQRIRDLYAVHAPHKMKYVDSMVRKLFLRNPEDGPVLATKFIREVEKKYGIVDPPPIGGIIIPPTTSNSSLMSTTTKSDCRNRNRNSSVTTRYTHRQGNQNPYGDDDVLTTSRARSRSHQQPSPQSMSGYVRATTLQQRDNTAGGGGAGTPPKGGGGGGTRNNLMTNSDYYFSFPGRRNPSPSSSRLAGSQSQQQKQHSNDPMRGSRSPGGGRTSTPHSGLILNPTLSSRGSELGRQVYGIIITPIQAKERLRTLYTSNPTLLHKLRTVDDTVDTFVSVQGEANLLPWIEQVELKHSSSSSRMISSSAAASAVALDPVPVPPSAINPRESSVVLLPPISHPPHTLSPRGHQHHQESPSTATATTTAAATVPFGPSGTSMMVTEEEAKQRLRAVYTRHAPHKLPTIDDLVVRVMSAATPPGLRRRVMMSSRNSRSVPEDHHHHDTMEVEPGAKLASLVMQVEAKYGLFPPAPAAASASASTASPTTGAGGDSQLPLSSSLKVPGAAGTGSLKTTTSKVKWQEEQTVGGRDENEGISYGDGAASPTTNNALEPRSQATDEQPGGNEQTIQQDRDNEDMSMDEACRRLQLVYASDAWAARNQDKSSKTPEEVRTVVEKILSHGRKISDFVTMMESKYDLTATTTTNNAKDVPTIKLDEGVTKNEAVQQPHQHQNQQPTTPVAGGGDTFMSVATAAATTAVAAGANSSSTKKKTAATSAGSSAGGVMSSAAQEQNNSESPNSNSHSLWPAMSNTFSTTNLATVGDASVSTHETAAATDTSPSAFFDCLVRVMLDTDNGNNDEKDKHHLRRSPSTAEVHGVCSSMVLSLMRQYGHPSAQHHVNPVRKRNPTTTTPTTHHHARILETEEEATAVLLYAEMAWRYLILPSTPAPAQRQPSSTSSPPSTLSIPANITVRWINDTAIPFYYTLPPGERRRRLETAVDALLSRYHLPLLPGPLMVVGSEDDTTAVDPDHVNNKQLAERISITRHVLSQHILWGVQLLMRAVGAVVEGMRIVEEEAGAWQHDIVQPFMSELNLLYREQDQRLRRHIAIVSKAFEMLPIVEGQRRGEVLLEERRARERCIEFLLRHVFSPSFSRLHHPHQKQSTTTSSNSSRRSSAENHRNRNNNVTTNGRNGRIMLFSSSSVEEEEGAKRRSWQQHSHHHSLQRSSSDDNHQQNRRRPERMKRKADLPRFFSAAGNNKQSSSSAAGTTVAASSSSRDEGEGIIAKEEKEEESEGPRPQIISMTDDNELSGGGGGGKQQRRGAALMMNRSTTTASLKKGGKHRSNKAIDDVEEEQQNDVRLTSSSSPTRVTVFNNDAKDDDENTALTPTPTLVRRKNLYERIYDETVEAVAAAPPAGESVRRFDNHHDEHHHYRSSEGDDHRDQQQQVEQRHSGSMLPYNHSFSGGGGSRSPRSSLSTSPTNNRSQSRNSSRSRSRSRSSDRKRKKVNLHRLTYRVVDGYSSEGSNSNSNNININKSSSSSTASIYLDVSPPKPRGRGRGTPPQSAASVISSDSSGHVINIIKPGQFSQNRFYYDSNSNRKHQTNANDAHRQNREVERKQRRFNNKNENKISSQQQYRNDKDDRNDDDIVTRMLSDPLLLSPDTALPSVTPSTTSGHPVASSDHPVTSADHPVTSADHPVTSADHPVTSADHPVASSDHPQRPRQFLDRYENHAFPDHSTPDMKHSAHHSQQSSSSRRVPPSQSSASTPSGQTGQAGAASTSTTATTRMTPISSLLFGGGDDKSGHHHRHGRKNTDGVGSVDVVAGGNDKRGIDKVSQQTGRAVENTNHHQQSNSSRTSNTRRRRDSPPVSFALPVVSDVNNDDDDDDQRMRHLHQMESDWVEHSLTHEHRDSPSAGRRRRHHSHDSGDSVSVVQKKTESAQKGSRKKAAYIPVRTGSFAARHSAADASVLDLM